LKAINVFVLVHSCYYTIRRFNIFNCRKRM
jgi:hypothetical protein